MARDESKHKLQELCDGLVKNLGGMFWTAKVDDNGNYATLSYMGREAFTLHGNNWSFAESTRVEISCNFPRFNGQPVLSFYNGEKAPRRTCALKRGARAIAHDIKQYLFSEWYALYEKAEGIVEDWTRKRECRLTTAEGFAAAVGSELGDLWRDRCNAGERPIIHLSRRGYYLGGEAIIGNDDMEIKLRNIPFEMGFKIATLITEYFDNPPQEARR
jgi:hypothetical protein